jgi:hypothetical protein
VIVDIEATSELDIGSLDVLVRLAEQVREDGAELWLAPARMGVRSVLGRAGIAESGPPRWFHTLPEALDAFESRGDSP